MQVEPSIVDELERRDGREGLADRADLEQRVGSDRSLRCKIRESVSPDEKRAVAIGQAEREPRLSSALHLRFHGGVDGRQCRVVDHAAIVRLIPVQSGGLDKLF